MRVRSGSLIAISSDGLRRIFPGISVPGEWIVGRLDDELLINLPQHGMNASIRLLQPSEIMVLTKISGIDEENDS